MFINILYCLYTLLRIVVCTQYRIEINVYKHILYKLLRIVVCTQYRIHIHVYKHFVLFIYIIENCCLRTVLKPYLLNIITFCIK